MVETIPVNKHLLVEIIKEEKQESAIIVTESKKPYKKGKVLKVASDSEINFQGKDFVLFNSFANKITLEENVVLIRDDDILAVL